MDELNSDTILCTIILGLQTWQLRELVAMKTNLAVVTATCNGCKESTLKRAAVAGLIVAASLFLFSGCAVADRVFLAKPAPQVIGDGGTVPTPEVITVSPVLTNTVAQLRTVNSVIPSPVQPLIDYALGGLAGLAGLYAAMRTKQLKSKQSQLEQETELRGKVVSDSLNLQSALAAVVKGVETFATSYTQGDVLKRQIKEVAREAGVEELLHATVSDVTRKK